MNALFQVSHLFIDNVCTIIPRFSVSPAVLEYHAVTVDINGTHLPSSSCTPISLAIFRCRRYLLMRKENGLNLPLISACNEQWIQQSGLHPENPLQTSIQKNVLSLTENFQVSVFLKPLKQERELGKWFQQFSRKIKQITGYYITWIILLLEANQSIQHFSHRNKKILI